MAVTLYGSKQAIIQAVSSTLTTSFSTSSSTPVTTGLTASITPSSSSNKILVIVTTGCLGSSASANFLTLNRSGTNIAIPTTGGTNMVTAGVSVNAAGGSFYQGGFNYLDSPSSTSSLTYSLYMSSDSGTTAYLNRRASDTFLAAVSTITLLEVAYA